MHSSEGSSPSKVSQISSGSSSDDSGTDSFSLSGRAYAKMILHAAKYPHCAVNGVLLVKIGPKGQRPAGSAGQKLVFVDCIPLFHQIHGLTPMIEVALAQIGTRAAGAGMAIAGYYHANSHFKDTRVDVFSQRISDRVADHSPGGKAALITIDNKKLGLNLEGHALIGQLFSGGGVGEGGKWRQVASKSIKVGEETLGTTSYLIRNKAYTSLVDFDNHFDNITQDYLNVNLNMEIDTHQQD